MSNKIKILQFELDENPGGIETFLLNVYSNIDKEKYQFDFITRSSNPAKAEELKKLGAKIYRVSSYKNPVKYILEIRKILSEGYDIVHINKNSAANILPFIIAKKYSNTKVIAHSHNTMPTVSGATKTLHFINRSTLYRLSDVHLACSNEAGKWLYSGRPYKVIANGIDCSIYKFSESVREEYRNKLGLENSFAILNVGRFTDQKNHKRLIEIFKEILKQRENSKLVLIGTGPLKSQIKESANSLGLLDKVIFLEKRNDVSKIMMACDCFIMPSLYEGLPFAAIEAQASGLPVFLADSISRETAVTDSVKWFSLSESNHAIAGLIKPQSVDRNEMNLEVMNSQYNIRNTVSKLEEIYSSLY